ncbi:MAG: hypothetical protein ACI9OJ_001397 [Myxococcota bacterium]|jgi:hypothetical protein
MRGLWIAGVLTTVLVGCPGDDSGDGTAPAPDTGTIVVTDTGSTDLGLPEADSGVPDIGDVDDPTLRAVNVEPGLGATKGGDVVTINGNGFVQDQHQVFFGASLATNVFVIGGSRLTCTTPPNSPGLVDVTVTKPGTGETVIIEFGFRYESEVLITGVEPPTGDISGGQPATISGSGFSQGIATVLIGDRKAINVQVVDDSTIHLTTPVATTDGLVDVYVSNPQGSALLKEGFRYTRTPSVDSVTPGAGPTSGGTEVTIEGAGFSDDTTVQFGGINAAKVTFVGATRLLAVAPAHAAGPASVTVENDYGFGGLVNAFAFLDEEPVDGVTVVGITPPSGSADGGDTVHITAYGLESATDTTVQIGGEAATIVSVSPANLSVVATTPAHAVGPVDVIVTTSAGTDTLQGGYLFKDVVKVLTVDPGLGPDTGGTAITVYGQGFLNGATVRVGALPCADVVIAGKESLSCVTPPGSPGNAAVTVQVGPDSATLDDGFYYESGSVQLFVVDPTSGSQAGGTFVRLLGSEFEQPLDVFFDGNLATHVKVVNSTLITAKTPPGTVGTVDVSVDGLNGSAVLSESFTYYDPVALFGGTWGPGVEGAVNVTVLDGGSGDPLADAFVMLKTDPDTPYQGFSNADGQITFSGPDVLGDQMVSASLEGYESKSVIAFEALNITIYMVPIPPPSSGPPPPGATISGQVYGLGKYVAIPPGNCLSTGVQANGACQACETSVDCAGVANSCSTMNNGSFCTATCLSEEGCDTGFSCLNLAGAASAQCLPTPGRKEARCFTSMGSIFGQLPDDETANIIAEDGTYTLGTRLGEIAVICLGGYVDWNNPDNNTNFTPLAFGVNRHINVAVGPNVGYDVTLNHPMNRSVKVRLDDPPFDTEIGPEYLVALVYWDFGSDGGFMHRSFQNLVYGGAAEQVLEVGGQPHSFTGDVYDARFQILGVALSFDFETNDQLPVSYTLLNNLKQIETDQAFVLDAGHWDGVNSGVTATINALWGFSDSDVWAVGPSGGLTHYNGGNWSIQAPPANVDLYGIWGSAPDDIWAVGADGTTARFNGSSWTADKIVGANADLRAVWGSDPNNVWAVGASWSGTWHFDGTQWTKTTAPGGDMRDIHGSSATNVIMVGRYGSIRHWDGTNWTTAIAPGSPDLYSVHVVSTTEAYAVGEAGVVLLWDGTVWTPMDTPTKKNLRAVWANGPIDVYAVGDASTLLHYDGNGWAEQTVLEKVSYNALQALWANPLTSKGFALGTSEVLMGPMMQVPQDQTPEDGGVMNGYHIGFGVKPGVDAHFNRVSVAIPGAFGDTPVWSITTAGDVFEFDLPDFENIEGTPGIADGSYKLTIIRAYKDNFDIDNYDLSDFSQLDWRSWSIDVTYFTK